MFVQQVFIEEELEIEESGEILFKEVSKLKWTYLDPDYKVFTMIGNNYKFYDKENNQLMIGKIAEKNQKWIWQILFSKDIAGHIKCDQEKRKIYIKDEEEELNFEVIVGDGWLPEKVIHYDPSGAKYIYKFSNYKSRVKIAKEDFELELPEDIEIIDGNLDY